MPQPADPHRLEPHYILAIYQFLQFPIVPYPPNITLSRRSNYNLRFPFCMALFNNIYLSPMCKINIGLEETIGNDGS